MRLIAPLIRAGSASLQPSSAGTVAFCPQKWPFIVCPIQVCPIQDAWSLYLPLAHCAVKSLRVARMVLLAMHLFFPLAIVQVLLSISAFPSARARIQPTPPSAARAGNRGPEPPALLPNL